MPPKRKTVPNAGDYPTLTESPDDFGSGLFDEETPDGSDIAGSQPDGVGTDSEYNGPSHPEDKDPDFVR